MLRIVEQAERHGYNAICNLRMETADITGSTVNRKGAVSVTVLAAATTYRADA